MAVTLMFLSLAVTRKLDAPFRFTLLEHPSKPHMNILNVMFWRLVFAIVSKLSTSTLFTKSAELSKAAYCYELLCYSSFLQWGRFSYLSHFGVPPSMSLLHLSKDVHLQETFDLIALLEGMAISTLLPLQLCVLSWMDGHQHKERGPKFSWFSTLKLKTS